MSNCPILCTTISFFVKLVNPFLALHLWCLTNDVGIQVSPWDQGIVSKLSIAGKYADLYYTPDQEDAFSHQIAASLYNENHDQWSFQ